MNQIVFSPYWNVPPSILRKEILPAIAKTATIWHTIWNGLKPCDKGQATQNALGQVKFVFPNSHYLYA
jgi:murein L,D-transpeptidase YcbB/YkuD